MHHVKDRVSVSGVGRQCRVHSTLSYILKKQRMYREKTDFVCLLCVSANECFLFFCPCGHSIKEVFQPHLPVRLPCYDLAPVTCFTLDRSSRLQSSGAPGSHGLTGGVYKARERIHRAVADARLLANPASWSRVADSSPN